MADITLQTDDNSKSTSKNQILKGIYYNPKTGFKSTNRLYKEANQKNNNITHSDVKKFLDQQE